MTFINYRDYNMNIEKEIAKYNSKKASLMNNLIDRLSSYVSGRRSFVEKLDKTMDDLEDQKSIGLEEISIASDAIRNIK